MARTRLQGMDMAGVKLAIEVPAELAPGHALAEGSNAGMRWPRCSPVDATLHVGVRVAHVESPLRDAYWYRGERATFEVGRLGGNGRRAGDWVIAVYGSRGCERVARFDDALRDVDLVIDPVALSVPTHPLEDPIDEILLLHQLAASGGAMVQGRLVRGPGDGATLTVGDSDGPTLSGGVDDVTPRALAVEVAPAERVVLRLGEHDDEVWAYPAGGNGRAPTFGIGERVRLRAIRIVESARNPFKEPLDPEAAACELLAYASAPVHFAEGALRVASTIERITARVPSRRVGEPQKARVVGLPWGNRQAGFAFAPPS
jgi:hypothetical protein